MSAMRRSGSRVQRIPPSSGAPRVGRRPDSAEGSGDRDVAAVPRLALTPTEAAAALGMGLTSFKKYVQPQLRIVRRGKLRVIPVSEVERWAEENAERVFGGASEPWRSDSARV
jgi:hypothetical protein